tara:strand:- start:33533 stop:36802 length:3270 start_codon:yes stop_codon:yes gene_type:complete
MEKLYKIGKSQIAGQGLLASRNLNPGEVVGISHSNGQPSSDIGQYYNHSESANAISELIGEDRYVIVSTPINKDEEIVLDYREQPELEQPEDFNGENLTPQREIPYAQDGIEVPKREGVRLNYDEEGNVIGESTHIMRTETDGKGNWFSFPTLFQNEDGTWVDMSSFVEQDWMPVYQEALKRGEVIDFGEDKEAAIKFGEGSWKKKLKYGGSLPKAQFGAQLANQLIKQTPKWGAFNKSIPKNKILMQEYRFIEETTKANKTWMKNADGTDFMGTPEQFVQSKSSNFQKAYPNVLKEDNKIMPLIHHSNKIFDFFDESLSSNTKYGKGVYTRPEAFHNKRVAKSFAEMMDKSNEKSVFQMYGNKRYNLYSNDIPELRKLEYRNERGLFPKGNIDYENISTIISPFSNPLKSMTGNDGMFDLTNPNIYKQTGGSLPKAQSGTELSMCSNGEWNGKSVKTACGNRDSAHNLYGSTGITIGDISDKSLSGSVRGGLGYSAHVPYSPMTGHLGLSAGTRFTGDEQSMMFNPTFDATGSVGIEGEFGGNSYNWRDPWKYGAGVYGKQDLTNGTGTTFGLYGNVGNFSGKFGYNANTGPEATIGFGLPIRQRGGLFKSFKSKLQNNPIKRKYDALKYNRSVDAFGNTGLSFSNDLQHPISRGSSILQYRGLQNTNPYTKDLEEMMAEYTIDSAPFKFGSKLGKAPKFHQPLSVIRDADGNIINAEDNRYAIKLQDVILNNKLKWASGNDKPLSLTRKFNETENRTGIHGNIADLKKKFKSGETFKLGDNTSWSVGTESVQNFGEHRYVIKDFDFDTPALLNEYKDLTKNQKKVMLNEREVVLADPKFKVTNFIKNAPRPHGLRIDTKQPELNNTGLQKQFGDVLHNKIFWSDGKDGYKKHLEYNTDISKPFDTFGKPNPMYEKYLWLKENDPSFKTTTIPNYGTDIELQLMKKRGGAMKKNKKYAQSPFSKDKLTVIDPTSMVKEIAEIGGFTSEFKNGGTLKLINGYTASKQYDKQRKLPFFAYGGQPNIEGRLYYDQDSQDDLYNFNMIDITDELIKKQNKHNRTKMIIEKYENNLELSATESEHLNSLGLLD